MMFSRLTKPNTLSIFKWFWLSESSLTTGLLQDVAPEVELSNYGRVPSTGSESPSGLLNGESLSVEPISDLDLFFERLYSYYCEKGLWCIVIKWIVELLSLGFTICFSGFFLLIVDWNGLRNAKCGMVAVESGSKPCDLSREALHQHPLAPFTLSKAIVVGYLGIFSIYWIFCFLKIFVQLKVILGIRNFYYNRLHVTDNEIQTMPWPSIIEKMVQIQTSHQLCVQKNLSEHDVVMRLMRKENYLIGMINKGVLSFPLCQWIPGSARTVKVGSNRQQHRFLLTKTLEWTLNWCILQSMFDRNFCLKQDFVSNPSTLKKRLVIVGLVMLLVSPFLVIFMLVYLFLRHAEQFYNHPTTASSHRWSNLSRWIFREFNEVDHLFKHRINRSVDHASDYLKQFPCPIISIIAKFISFVSGGFAAILIIIAFLEESLLEAHIFGRNLLWYAAIFGTITAISRAAIVDELLVFDPEGAMSLVVQHTHYIPKKWRGKENTDLVRNEFETLFQYMAIMVVEEIFSIFLTPFLLLFVVPKRVDDILQFISDYTVHVEGVGHVCSFSVFEFQNHGNSNYGSPHNGPRAKRSSQGKMEKSFLSFHSDYPSWEPNTQGKQFLLTLRRFREQKFQVQEPLWRRSTDLRNRADFNGFLSRDMLQNVPRTCCQLGRVIDMDKKCHPYLLDWYYTSQPHHATNHAREIPDAALAKVVRDDDNMKSSSSRSGTKYEECWGHLSEGRSRSHLEASTSSPLFQESILQHEPGYSWGQPMKSHWWTRTRSQQGSVSEPQESFLEPPMNFNRPAPYNGCHVIHMGRSTEEDQYLDWKNWEGVLLGRSTFMDDDDHTGEDVDVSLYFDDIYGSKPPEPLQNFE